MEDIEKLQQVIMDTLPHWAMLIDVKTRTVLAANKLAMEGGATVHCQCWDDFGHRLFIPEEQKRLIEENPERKRDNKIKCEFCLADEAMESGEPTRKEVEIQGIIWDTWWVPVEKDMYLHYAMDITDIRKAEADRLKAARLESMFQTVAAVCHTINQPLQVVTSAVDLMEDEIEHDLVSEAKEAVWEIGRITRKLQTICKYETKEHLDGTQILDIDAASKQADN